MTQAGFASQGALADAADVSRETVNNLLGQKVDADPSTLAKLAKACRVSVPIVEWRFSVEGGVQEPPNALGWITEAQAALDRAAG